jgi:hypothetical protein
VFTIKDDAITPRRGQLERALDRLADAHVTAQKAGASHLHRAVAHDAAAAGLPTSPLTVGWEQGQAYLGIDHSPEGDQLADREYGTPDAGAEPVLRVAHRQHWDAANGHYAHTLIREVGL